MLENISQDLQDALVDEHANEKPPPMGKYTEKSASISERAMRLFKTPGGPDYRRTRPSGYDSSLSKTMRISGQRLTSLASPTSCLQ